MQVGMELHVSIVVSNDCNWDMLRENATKSQLSRTSIEGYQLDFSEIDGDLENCIQVVNVHEGFVLFAIIVSHQNKSAENFSGG